MAILLFCAAPAEPLGYEVVAGSPMGAGSDTPSVVVLGRDDMEDLGLGDLYSEDCWFLMLSPGRRPSTGFGLRVLGLTPRGDTLWIKAQEICPPRGAMVAMVITHPWVVIKVWPKREFGAFRLELEPCGD